MLCLLLAACGEGNGPPPEGRQLVTLRAQWQAVEQATRYEGQWWTSLDPRRTPFRTTHDFAEWQVPLTVGASAYVRVRSCRFEDCGPWSPTAETVYR